MAFDQSTRNRLQQFVQKVRALLTEEFTRQMQKDYGMDPTTGEVNPLDKLTYLDDSRRETARLLRETMEHYLASTPSGDKIEVLDRIVREQSFTVLNRLCAVRMAEARGIIIESIGNGYHSKGFQLYNQLTKTSLGELGDAYRWYLFSVFDEFAMDLPVLFDRYSPMGRLFPKPEKLISGNPSNPGLIEVMNSDELVPLWSEDETIGWIYQYFNSVEERRQMRDESAAPRNSRELAVRNQFFTPRYVVEFLTDNTLGRIWYEMTQGQTSLTDTCQYLVRRPNEIFLKPGEAAPVMVQPAEELSQEELLRQPVYISFRPLKDPREILMLDPACGSMHFGLYAFDLFERIYEEAWDIEAELGKDLLVRAKGLKSLHDTYTTKEALLTDIPRLIIEYNIHGVDIDPRAVQIAGLSLWLRAQRSWKERNIKSDARPQIRRSNIVCAEPMPGEVKFLEEFITKYLATIPEGKLLGQIVRRVFEAMQLAGEAGSLLKIEEEISNAIAEAKRQWLAKPKTEQGRLFNDENINPQQQRLGLDVSGITDKAFWETAEEQIYGALRSYAEQAELGEGYQRRLFADDAARGFAFINNCRKRYDVVLMNPPFGEPSLQTESLVKYIKESCNNVFCSFVVQSTSRLSEGGALGAITDRSFVVKDSYEDYRYWLYKNASPDVFVDLGWNVLDANVEVCCYIVRPNLPREDGLFLNISEISNEEKPGYLYKKVGLTCEIPKEGFLKVSFDVFGNIPHFAMSYFLPSTLLTDFETGVNIQTIVAKTARGMSSGDTFMACRLLWEISSDSIGSKKPWNYVNVGGGTAPFYRPQFMLFKYSDDWGPLRHLPGFSLKNINLFWKTAVGWGKRTDILSAQLLPPGLITAEDGQVAVPFNESDTFLLLGFLNSKYAQSAINCICGGHKGPGYVGSIPFPTSIRKKQDRINEVTKKGFNVLRTISICNETTLEFCHPFALSEIKSRNNLVKDTLACVEELIKQANILLRELDEVVFNALGKSEIEQSQIVKIGPGTLDPRLEWPENITDLESALISYSFGVIFGRWDVRYATGEKQAPELPDPFTPLAVCPTGMLQNEQGLPITKEEVESLKQKGEWNYPIEIPWGGVLIDDPGHSMDIETHLHQVLQIIWQERWEDIEREACEILGVRTLRDYFTKSAGFFADHLKRYSKSRRQAPIYWPLSTASGSYMLWIYYHRLTDQTLYICVNDFVEPKLQQVGNTVSQLRRKEHRNAQEEKELEKLSDLETELKEFRDELLRIAKFWKPNFNDGVQITAAPLWKLFKLPKWQKTLKETWQMLEKGEYDWANLAYSIWPERVIRKAHQDRSLATAHDLEADLWEEIVVSTDREGNPKMKWIPKKLSEEQLKEIIQAKMNNIHDRNKEYQP